MEERRRAGEDVEGGRRPGYLHRVFQDYPWKTTIRITIMTIPKTMLMKIETTVPRWKMEGHDDNNFFPKHTNQNSND